MQIAVADGVNAGAARWSLHLGEHRQASAESDVEACLRDLNAFVEFGGLGLTDLPTGPAWAWSRSGDILLLNAALPNVGTRAWFLMLQVIRFIDSEVIEIPRLTIAAEHDALRGMSLDSLGDWNEAASTFDLEVDPAPPDVTLRVTHAGDQAASDLLLHRLGVWFSVVSDGVFAGEPRVPSGGWIALDDAPDSRPGFVGLNLANVACHDIAFQALEAVVSRFHGSIAQVHELQII